jgi:hypothetical protein
MDNQQLGALLALKDYLRAVLKVDAKEKKTAA